MTIDIEEVRKSIQDLIDKYYLDGKKPAEILNLVTRDVVLSYNAGRYREDIQAIVKEELSDFILKQKRQATAFGKKYPDKNSVSRRKKILEEIRKMRLSGGRKPGESLYDYQTRYAEEKDRKAEYEREKQELGRLRKEKQITGRDYRDQMDGLESRYQDIKTDRPLKELVKKEKALEKERKKLPDWEADKQKFDQKTLKEREAERERWYKQENDIIKERYKGLKDQLKRGTITRDEFENAKAQIQAERSELRRRAYGDIGFKRSMRFFGRGLSKVGEPSKSKYGSQLKNVMFLLAAIVVGVAVTATTGSWFFLIGFMGVGVYLVAPDPKNIKEKPGQKIGFSSILLFHPETRSNQNTASFIRSLGKATAIAFFAFGFNDLGDVFHIFYIATAVVGYFMLKVEYSNSGEFIESLMRFFLGIILIPWIFNDIFDSLVLAGIAFAFFAVPPLPDESNKNIGEVLSRGLSGATAYYEMAEKFIFGIIMVIVGIASGAFGFMNINPAAGWQLTGALQYTFLYFWIVCGIAGFFSPAKERPITGGIMLGAATIIYGIGPGSQQVGSGLLGQWWPSVHNTFTSFTEPMSNLMGDIGGTFSQGFLLLTNPVGYATQLMNGTYASNPTGQTGAFGLEMEELSITGIYPEQPFVVTSILKNEGAYPAKNVYLSILAESPDKYATTGTTRTEDSPIWRSERMIDIGSLGFLGPDSVCENNIPEESVFGHEDMETKVCLQYYGGEKENELDKQMVWQASFGSTGINCEAIVGNSLRKKFIPITVKSEYDYKSDSRVDVEFISEDEWQRLAQAGQLDSQFHLVESSYSSAPVIFPIGTAGLKNPILSTQPFHVSMVLDSAYPSKSEIVSIGKINVSFPSEWMPRGGSYEDACIVSGAGNVKVEENEDGKDIVTWNQISGGTKNIVCYFNALVDLGTARNPMGSAPTKSYLVTAHAEYRFSRWRASDTRIEFGGFCCPNNPDCTENCVSDDCPNDGQVCLQNACVSGDSHAGSSGETTGDNEWPSGTIADVLNVRGASSSGNMLQVSVKGLSSGEVEVERWRRECEKSDEYVSYNCGNYVPHGRKSLGSKESSSQFLATDITYTNNEGKYYEFKYKIYLNGIEYPEEILVNTEQFP